jgi:hypothetical protein
MSGKVPDKVKLDIFTNESPDKPVNPQEKDKVWNQLLENK